MDFDQLINEKKVIICCGSGGVGKTTLSAALGFYAAGMGKRVLVLTIDPARRLANALGVDELGHEEKPVAVGRFSGELYASMLDMKRTFDEFIMSLAPSPEVAQRVLTNHIYNQLSTALNGSQEYTALEKLLQLNQAGKYDLVILDTPPTKHAIDFLNAPVKIHTLFQDTIMKWFLMPFNTLDKMSLGIMNRGTKLAFKAFEKLAGSEFLSTLTDFFAAIRDWQKVLRDRTAEVHRLLTSSQTAFVLVTGFNAVKIEEARYFERTLKKGGYTLSAIIVNRAFPLWGQNEIGLENLHTNTEMNARVRVLIDYYNDLRSFYSDQMAAFESFQREMSKHVLFVRLPEFNEDVHDFNALAHVVERLKLAVKASEALP